MRQALEHDPRVIVEAHSGGLEVECSVLGPTDAPKASQPGEIVVNSETGWYDYEAKYTEGGMELVVPARISAAARERVRHLACEAFTLAGCSGLARVDFFVDGDECCSTSSTPCPARRPPASTASSGRPAASVPRAAREALPDRDRPPRGRARAPLLKIAALRSPLIGLSSSEP